MIPIIGALIPILGRVLDKAIPDKAERDRIEAEMTRELLASHAEMQRAAADVVKAEIQGEGWLQRSWRPILMLTFGALIVARWLGFAAPGLSEAEYLKLWSIVEIGLGGYVVGRSLEKVVDKVSTTEPGSPLDRWRASR